jgi:LysR family transcriptional regulator, transcription activator of glutamate synthase operon
VPALLDEQHDLAFIRDYHLDPDVFGFVEIYRDQMVVLVSRQHAFAQRDWLSLSELANENFILFDKGTVVHELSVDACRQAGFEPCLFYASFRVESVLSLVASNMGVALMMKRISEYHQQPDVVSIPLKKRVASNLVLAYLKKKKLSRPAKNFIDLVQKQLRENEPDVTTSAR